MGEERNKLLKAFLMTDDGEYVPVSALEDINVVPDESLEGTNKMAIDYIRDDGKTFTFDMRIPRWLMKALFSWKAKGPIRYKAINAAYDWRLSFYARHK